MLLMPVALFADSVAPAGGGIVSAITASTESNNTENGAAARVGITGAIGGALSGLGGGCTYRNLLSDEKWEYIQNMTGKENSCYIKIMRESPFVWTAKCELENPEDEQAAREYQQQALLTCQIQRAIDAPVRGGGRLVR